MRRVTTTSGLHYQLQPTPIGMLGVVAGEGGLLEILLQPSAAQVVQLLHTHHPQAREHGSALLQEAQGQFADYFLRQRRSFALPIDFAGLSPFTLAVLRTLQGIPFGATVSYAQLAQAAGCPGAARAVGGVMAANPFPILIPCHRVLGSGGKLGGYSGGEGVATKKWLLAFEGEA